MKIKKESLLIEKLSDSYGCPNYINPKYGKKILDSLNIDSTEDGNLLFTEVIENFGIELAKNIKGKLTKEKVIELTRNISVE